LALWEELRLPLIVVAKLTEPVQLLIRHDLAEVEYQALDWPHACRIILLRHRQAERLDAGGKKLIDLPDSVLQALVNRLPSHVPLLSVGRDDNGRADCENVIKELQQGFALPTPCLESFWAAEAALSVATLTYNLTGLFHRHLVWQTKVTIHSLRFWLFRSLGLIAHPAGNTTIKLAVPLRERDGWSRRWEKILSPFPNFNAVEHRHSFTAGSPPKSNSHGIVPAEIDCEQTLARPQEERDAYGGCPDLGKPRGPARREPVKEAQTEKHKQRRQE
jgi:hypothetical protein